MPVFNIVKCAGNHRDSHREVQNREHGKQRNNSSYDVVEDGEKPKLLGVLAGFHVTRPTVRSRERRLEQKRRKGRVKDLRRTPDDRD